MNNFRNYGYFKSFVLPAFLLFLLPVFSFWFYHHAQDMFDARIVEASTSGIMQARDLTPKQRDRLIDEVKAIPLSKLLASNTQETRELTANIPDYLKSYYRFFRIMAQVALGCIVSGIAMFVLMGISVHFASKSQRSQYLSLAAGWQLLRVFVSLQAVAQCVLAVSLSFWITALWFHIYERRLIFIVALVALGALYAILAAIFRRASYPFNVGGIIIDRKTAPEFWKYLDELCTRVGTDCLDHVIAGIDDNFFVTESPVIVDGKRFKGRTLFISLTLVRVMPDDEVKSVLAHELAHFGGNDTYYSNKINRILIRYGHYLDALEKGFISLPVFYFALLFRVLFEANLRKLSREREFRADRIAALVTSPLAFSGALLRIAAFSVYHDKTELEIYNSKETEANLVERLKDGFPSFVAQFVSEQNWGSEVTVHPFDSHPPTSHRIEMLGVEFTPHVISEALAKPADEAWYHRIDNAEAIENEQWTAYQDQFRKSHEVSLAYRFTAENEEERKHIELHFPTRTIELPRHTEVTIDFEKVVYTKWNTPVYWSDVLAITAENDFGTNVFVFALKSNSLDVRKLPMPKKQEEMARLQQILGDYFGRYRVAARHKADLEAKGELVSMTEKKEIMGRNEKEDETRESHQP